MTAKTRTISLEEQQALAAARHAEHDAQVERLIAVGAATRWPCGHVGYRDRSLDDEPGAPYFGNDCGCADGARAQDGAAVFLAAQAHAKPDTGVLVVPGAEWGITDRPASCLN